MTNLDETNTLCECRYILDEDVQEMKNCFNIPDVHEIDEEESETEETTLNRPDLLTSDEEGDKTVQKTRDISDESVYTGESFYSDVLSCDESEVTNVTSGSLNSSSLIHVADFQFSSKEHDVGISESSWKNDHQDKFDISFRDEPRHSATVDRDRFVKSKKCRRWNMSFTDEDMRKIERENELLLRKIMAQQKPRHKILGENTVQSRLSSSAINRKKLQTKIENDNMLLLRRIQQTKSRLFMNTSKVGGRLTFV